MELVNKALIWGDAADATRTIPTAIVTPDGELRDAVAWLSTYVGAIRPFTAYCRVVDWRQWCLTQDNSQGRLPEDCVHLFSSLIVCDALNQYRDQLDSDTVTVAALKATYSYARARHVKCYRNADQFSERIQSAWTLSRQCTDQPSRLPSIPDLERIWNLGSAVLGIQEGLANESTILLEAVNELHANGMISQTTCRQLFPDTSIHPATDSPNGTREDKVTALHQIIAATASHRLPRPESAFFCAYVASRMSPGTLEYLKLVANYSTAIPNLLLWYGLCEGLAKDTKVEYQLGGLGLRICRDVFSACDINNRPTSDIALEELRVIVEANSCKKYRLRYQANLDVEVTPFVSTLVRLVVAPLREVEPPEKQQAPSTGAKDLPISIGRLLDQLREAIANEFGLGAKPRAKTSHSGKSQYPSKARKRKDS